MPVMLRTSSKARKIARKIMGVPPAMVDQESKKQRKIKARLNFEDTVKSS